MCLYVLDGEDSALPLTKAGRQTVASSLHNINLHSFPDSPKHVFQHITVPKHRMLPNKI
jgi:hypothetical protein